MKTQEEIELDFRNQDLPNWPGYACGLEFRGLRPNDGPLIAPLIRSDRGNLSTFLGKFQRNQDFNVKSATHLVQSLIRQGWPANHWIFTICDEPVGMISTAEDEYPMDCQLILTVFQKHQGKGLAKAMTNTVLKICEEVFGFERVWWHVDGANFASIKVAQSCGFQLHDQYDTKVTRNGTTGIYWRFVKERPENLAPAILQGASIDYWWIAKDQGLLKLMVENQKRQSSGEKLSDK